MVPFSKLHNNYLCKFQWSQIATPKCLSNHSQAGCKHTSPLMGGIGKKAKIGFGILLY